MELRYLILLLYHPLFKLEILPVIFLPKNLNLIQYFTTRSILIVTTFWATIHSHRYYNDLSVTFIDSKLYVNALNNNVTICYCDNYEYGNTV